MLEDVKTPRARLADYLGIARPDHWIKNIFMLPGTACALVLTDQPLLSSLGAIIAAFLLLCIAASTNYTLNEYLDAQYDRFHPTKRNRPGALGLLSPRIVALQYTVLAIVALAGGWQIGKPFFAMTAALLVMGVLYNVPPARTKDRVYLDVLSESINNPLRLLLGWFAVIENEFPPSSILLAYWMGGAFLMGMKRYAEFRQIADPERAGAYRRSFRYYTEEKLLLSSFFYALCAAFFLGIFLIKYRIEFILTFPAFALLFTWYFAIALQRDSAAQAPEKLFSQKRFLAFVLALSLLVAVLFVLDIPALHVLVEPLPLAAR